MTPREEPPVRRRAGRSAMSAPDSLDGWDVTLGTGPERGDDAALVDSIALHPADAISDAYARHADAVIGLARRLLADRALAEEVTQEVFLRLWKDPDRFDEARGSLRSYLLAQCHGRSLDLIRKESARRRREEREATLHPSADDDVERQVCDAAAASEIAAALRTLPDHERVAIHLAYFTDNTYGEVAKLLHTPEGTVKSRIRSGLRRLAAELSELRG